MPTQKSFAEMLEFSEKSSVMKLCTLIRTCARTVRQMLEDRDNLQRYPTGDLNGYCAIGSAELWREFQRYCIETEIHIAEMDCGCHVFLTVEDYVVDVTATQFNEFHDQPIVILHRKLAEAYPFYQSAVSFKSDRELVKYQKKTQWHREQIATA